MNVSPRPPPPPPAAESGACPWVWVWVWAWVWVWVWPPGPTACTPATLTTPPRTELLSAVKAGGTFPPARSGGLPGGPPAPAPTPPTPTPLLLLLLPPEPEPCCCCGASRLLAACSWESLLQFWLPSLRSPKSAWASVAALRWWLSGRMTAAEAERL